MGRYKGEHLNESKLKSKIYEKLVSLVFNDEEELKEFLEDEVEFLEDDLKQLVKPKRDIKGYIKSALYKGEHAKQSKLITKGKKIKDISTNVAKKIVKNAFSIGRTLYYKGRKGIKPLLYRGEHAKQSKFTTDSKEMIKKIKILSSKCKEKYAPRLIEYKDIGINAVKEIGETIFSIGQTLYYRGRAEIRSLRSRPKITKNKIYTAEGNNKRKMKAFIAAVLAGITASVSSSTLNTTVHSIVNNNTNNSYHEMTDENNTISEDIEVIVQEDQQEKQTISFVPIAKSETENVKNSDVDEAKRISWSEMKEKAKSKPEDQIKTIYGGEISASENGILTEEDILYAATQMGWEKKIIDNIKEMMPGILAMQEDFDVSPLVFLAVAQGESCCGTAYQPGGSDYVRDNDYRAVNIEKWNGQIGVVNYSNTNYGIYSKWSEVPYDFGNYLRNGPPYSDESPALTMKDLKEHGNHKIIFNSADTKYAAIYNQLKDCLAKRVTIDDISEAVEGCTTSEIQEMTASIKSNIDKDKSVSQEMAER